MALVPESKNPRTTRHETLATIPAEWSFDFRSPALDDAQESIMFLREKRSSCAAAIISPERIRAAALSW